MSATEEEKSDWEGVIKVIRGRPGGNYILKAKKYLKEGRNKALDITELIQGPGYVSCFSNWMCVRITGSHTNCTIWFRRSGCGSSKKFPGDVDVNATGTLRGAKVEARVILKVGYWISNISITRNLSEMHIPVCTPDLLSQREGRWGGAEVGRQSVLPIRWFCSPIRWFWCPEGW